MLETKDQPPLNRSKVDSRLRRVAIGDKIFKTATMLFAWVAVLLILWIGMHLFLDSSLSRHAFGWNILTSSAWDEQNNLFGALPFIFGTAMSATVAIIIAAPIGVGAAAFLSEVAPKKVAGPISFFIELLAAVPSIVYGLWGFLVLCPFLQKHVSPWLGTHFGTIALFSGSPVPTNMLAAGLILAIMILPFISSISYQVLRAIPQGQRDAAIGISSTKWETIKYVLLPQAKGGIFGAIILGLGRALGETMAVALVIGNSFQINYSLLKPGYTMPALLANQFSEAFNVPLQRATLLEIAFILFSVTLVVNGAARWSLQSSQNRLSNKNFSVATRNRQAFVDRAIILIASTIGIGFLGLYLFSQVKSQGISFLWGPVPIIIYLGLGIRQLQSKAFEAGRLILFRRIASNFWTFLLSMCALLACVALGALFVFVAFKGIGGLNVNLFTHVPTGPTDTDSGLKNAMVGTIILVGISGAIGIPIGVMAAVYLSEFASGPVGQFIRFCTDVLNGIPSVVIGLFAYAAFVIPFKDFSGWAGGGALAIIIIPTVVRTTEEMLKLVPKELRDASMGLGSTKVQTILHVVIPTARNGIVTGIMLAIARVAGETAPLIFTAFGNDQLVFNPREKMSSLTLSIYRYATSPYDNQISQAWAGALVLLLFVLILSLIARFATKSKFAKA